MIIVIGVAGGKLVFVSIVDDGSRGVSSVGSELVFVSIVETVFVSTVETVFLSRIDDGSRDVSLSELSFKLVFVL